MFQSPKAQELLAGATERITRYRKATATLGTYQVTVAGKVQHYELRQGVNEWRVRV